MLPSEPSIEFSPLRIRGVAHRDETILDVARRSGAPIGNSCGATGICGRCAVRVVTGEENISSSTRIEQELMVKGQLSAGQRLACQTLVRGDCVVTTSYWG